MIYPETLANSGPEAAAKCAYIIGVLLDPESVLYSLSLGVTSIKDVIATQRALLVEAQLAIEEPDYVVTGSVAPGIADLEIAASAVEAATTETSAYRMPPWSSIARYHTLLANRLVMFQQEDVLQAADGTMLDPLVAYANDTGSAGDLALHKVLTKDLSWVDRFRDMKYEGALTPVAPVDRAVIIGSTGPFPSQPGDSYLVSLNLGTSFSWVPPVASSPVAYGTSESVTITDAGPAALTFDVGVDPVSTRKIGTTAVTSIGSGVVLVASTAGIMEGDYLYVPMLPPGQKWYEITGVGTGSFLCPTLTTLGAFPAEVYYPITFTVSINGTEYSCDSVQGTAVALSTIVGALAAGLPIAGPDAVTVTLVGTEITIATVATGAAQKLAWAPSPSGYYGIYDLFNINPTDTAAGTDDTTQTVLTTYLGSWTLTLPPTVPPSTGYTPAQLAVLISALDPLLSASVSLDGNLVVSVADYGDWAYLDSGVGNPLGLTARVWGASADLADTADLDFSVQEATYTSSVTLTLTNENIPYAFSGVTTSWVILLREVGEKAWRTYPIASIAGGVTALHRSPVVGASGTFEIKACYSPVEVRPMSYDPPGTISFTWDSVNQDYIWFDGQTAVSTARFVSPITTPVGSSPIRKGDWVLLPVTPIPDWAVGMVVAPSGVPQVWANYATWNYPSATVFPSGYVPGVGSPTIDDVDYAIGTVKAPMAVMSLVKAVTATSIELALAIPLLPLDSDGTIYGAFCAKALPYEKVVKSALAALTLPDPPTAATAPADVLAVLLAYDAALAAIAQYYLPSTQVPSVDGVISYLDGNHIDVLRRALTECRFDRFFLAEVGSSDLAAAAMVPGAIPEQITGLQGDSPETKLTTSLNPNTDRVEYVPDAEEEYY